MTFLKISSLMTLMALASPTFAGLPYTFDFKVYKDLPQKGLTQIGCINGAGNFITNSQYCLPFHANTSMNPTTIVGFYKCDGRSGTLNCSDPLSTGVALFGISGADLTYNGSTTFHQDQWPLSDDDTVGVPTMIGEGSNGTLLLQVHSVSG
ncbi:hypothetical protein SCUP234_08983 [Seiridium cupressi]